jgi:hypothetical protein
MFSDTAQHVITLTVALLAAAALGMSAIGG